MIQRSFVGQLVPFILVTVSSLVESSLVSNVTAPVANAAADLKNTTQTARSAFNPMPQTYEKGNLNYFYYSSASQEIKPLVTPSSELVSGKPFKIIIHGFNAALKPDINSISTSQKTIFIAEELAKHDPSLNIILIDWIKWATRTVLQYGESARHTRDVGMEVAEKLVALKNEDKVIGEWEHVHILGHSLGAHIAGVVGHTLKNLGFGPLGRITGLDPAGPGFDTGDGESFSDGSASLTSDDASFVDIIHTDAGTLKNLNYGSRVQAGHVDFYPNGGNNQLQCNQWTNFLHACSHAYSVIYYAMSVRQPDVMVACACSSYEKFDNKECPCDKDEHRMPLGELTLRRNVSGKYFMKINADTIGEAVKVEDGTVGQSETVHLRSTSRRSWDPEGEPDQELVY